MADLRITISRENPEAPQVTVGALPGTDAGTFEQAAARVKAVLEMLGVSGVKFVQLTEVEEHHHAEHAIVVSQPQVRQ